MSNIISGTIDQTFPEAGKDNDSQGFRTNFTIIKTALSVANTEITDLENNTAKTNVDTDFNNVIVENARIRRLYGIVGDIDTVTTGVNVLDVDSAVYFIGQTNGNCHVQFASWPTGGSVSRNYKVTLELRSSGSADQVTFSTATAIPGGGVFRDNSGSIVAGTSGGHQKITLSATSTTRTIVEAWTSNGGGIVYLKFIGQFQQ